MNKKTAQNKNDGAARADEPQDEIIIRGKAIPVHSQLVPLHKLSFYLDNPRLYSMVRINGATPTMEDIEEKLLAMDHVKQLIQSISMNGGLIDPVIVRKQGMIVLEGNSRLAAYRFLARKDAVKWGRMRARILPDDVTDAEVFALLGEYHIHGKANWVPFEQANYLYRRKHDQGISLEELAREINLSKPQVTHLIAVFQMMKDYQEPDISRWSYYDEYLKGRKIATARADYPNLDKLIIKKIWTGEIRTAADLRDGLKTIAQAGGKILNKFVEGKISFSEAREIAEQNGVPDVSLHKLSRFRKWLVEHDVVDDILSQPTAKRAELLYELDHIQKQALKIMRKLNAL